VIKSDRIRGKILWEVRKMSKFEKFCSGGG
jgi:hypothetical protein